MKIETDIFNYERGVMKMVQFRPERSRPWTVREFLVGLYCLGQEELCQVDSVYFHPPLCAYVMKQFSVKHQQGMDTLPHLTENGAYRASQSEGPANRRIRSVNGEKCHGDRLKLPWLNEAKVCKVASHLLRAFTYLLDKHFTHNDFSARNFLVGDFCKVGIPNKEAFYLCPIILTYWPIADTAIGAADRL
jgi:hypothetical protein